MLFKNLLQVAINDACKLRLLARAEKELDNRTNQWFNSCMGEDEDEDDRQGGPRDKEGNRTVSKAKKAQSVPRAIDETPNQP